MSEQNRRAFLKVAGVGVAAAGVAVTGVAGTAGAAGAATAAEAVALPPGSDGAILAHVHDVRAGTISLLVDGQEVTITDTDLAARIAVALHSHDLSPSS